MKAFKGFNKNLVCRGMQYEVGKDYEESTAKTCETGLHSCENPLGVFNYYAPSDSRYCEVEASGFIDKGTDDSKIASTRLHVSVEIGLKGIIEAGVKFIFDKVNWKDNKINNDLDQSAATNTGNRSAATNTGYQSAAIVKGKDSIALAMGIKSKAKASLDSWIVLTEWYENSNCGWHIKEVKTAKVDGEIIKADTFYKLVNGEFVEDIDE